MDNGLSLSGWFKKLWEGLVEPTWIGDARERQLSRILNIILLIFLGWGILFEIQSRIDHRLSRAGDTLTLLMICLLALAYYLNGNGHFSAAVVLTLGLFIAATFASVLTEHFQDRNNLSVLYYLIIAILISDLFFSMRGYLFTVSMILAGVAVESRRRTNFCLPIYLLRTDRLFQLQPPFDREAADLVVQ